MKLKQHQIYSSGNKKHWHNSTQKQVDVYYNAPVILISVAKPITDDELTLLENSRNCPLRLYSEVSKHVKTNYRKQKLETGTLR